MPSLNRLAVEAYESEERNRFGGTDEAMRAELDGFREASEKMLAFINSFAIFTISRPDARLAIWQAIYGAGLPCGEGMTMEARAKELGCTRAALSKGAKEFQRGLMLPMAEGMRDSAKACADARERQLRG